jgi:hypothetical protein
VFLTVADNGTWLLDIAVAREDGVRRSGAVQ